MAVWNAPAPVGFRWNRSDAGPSNRRAVTTTNLATDAAVVRAPAVIPLAQRSTAGQSPTLHASGMNNAHEPRLAVSEEQAKDVAARRGTAGSASLSALRPAPVTSRPTRARDSAAIGEPHFGSRTRRAASARMPSVAMTGSLNGIATPR